jgi:hypothetical protein
LTLGLRVIAPYLHRRRECVNWTLVQHCVGPVLPLCRVDYCAGITGNNREGAFAEWVLPSEWSGSGLFVTWINSAGAKITVSGFLRSSFEQSGLGSTDNARIFEINPVRSLEFEGEVWNFDLVHPDSGVPDWTAALNEIDERRTVQYWKGSDTFVFSNVGTEERGFFRVTGEVHDIKLNTGTNRPAWFVLNRENASRQIRVTCLKGTRPARMLRTLKSVRVSVIGLRSIDLVRALEDRYRINFIAFDVEPL